MNIGVAYLAWHALDPMVFQRFAESYRRHAAGCEHDLIVIYAGFDQPRTLQDAYAAFQDIPHIAIEVPDPRQDIAYYLEAARRVTHKYLCFLNTYTELAVDNWLALMKVHAERDHVGIVGATGSYESLLDSVRLYQKIKWFSDQSANQVTKPTAYYFGFHLTQACPLATVGPETSLPPGQLERWKAELAHFVNQRRLAHDFQAHWQILTSPGMPLADHRRFPSFPNPHIRTNGFMVRRDRLATFQPSQIKTKFDACAFESGVDSLTTQLRRAGLAAVVVASDGRGYDVPDWCRSGTFRIGEQSGLLLTDNRTREFTRMTMPARIVHARITWGDYLAPAPIDFPGYGYAFAKGSLKPAPPMPANGVAAQAFDAQYLGAQIALRALQHLTAPPRQQRRHLPIVTHVRATARRVVRATLPPFRRLDERVASDSQTIVRQKAEIMALRERIRTLEAAAAPQFRPTAALRIPLTEDGHLADD